MFPLPFIPTVELNIEGAFLTEDPLKLITEGRTYDVPWIVGFTSAECLGAITCKCNDLPYYLENVKMFPLKCCIFFTEIFFMSFVNNALCVSFVLVS